jgi:hypothetical protein
MKGNRARLQMVEARLEAWPRRPLRADRLPPSSVCYAAPIPPLSFVQCNELKDLSNQSAQSQRGKAQLQARRSTTAPDLTHQLGRRRSTTATPAGVAGGGGAVLTEGRCSDNHRRERSRTHTHTHKTGLSNLARLGGDGERAALTGRCHNCHAAASGWRVSREGPSADGAHRAPPQSTSRQMGYGGRGPDEDPTTGPASPRTKRLGLQSVKGNAI